MLKKFGSPHSETRSYVRHYVTHIPCSISPNPLIFHFICIASSCFGRRCMHLASDRGDDLRRPVSHLDAVPPLLLPLSARAPRPTNKNERTLPHPAPRRRTIPHRHRGNRTHRLLRQQAMGSMSTLQSPLPRQSTSPRNKGLH